MQRLKALAQELTPEEHQNASELYLTSGHLFEQSKNDYYDS